MCLRCFKDGKIIALTGEKCPCSLMLITNLTLFWKGSGRTLYWTGGGGKKAPPGLTLPFSV